MTFQVLHAKSNTIADFTGTVTVANSSGGTATVAATDLVRPSDWNSGHVWVPSPEFFEPFPLSAGNSTLTAQGVGTWYIDPFNIPLGFSKGQFNLLAADVAGFLNGTSFSAVTTGSNTRYQTMNTQLAIYSAGTGTGYSSMSTVWSTEISIKATWERRVTSSATNSIGASNYLTLSFPGQWDSLGGMTYSTTAQSGAVTVGASTMVSSSINSAITGAVAYVSGSKMIPVPFNTSLPPGEYYMAMMISSTSSSTGTNYSLGTMFSTQSVIGAVEFIHQAYKRLGSSASNSSTCIPAFHGILATTSSSPLATIRTSDMRNLAANHRRYWNFQQSDY